MLPTIDLRIERGAVSHVPTSSHRAPTLLVARGVRGNTVRRLVQLSEIWDTIRLLTDICTYHSVTLTAHVYLRSYYLQKIIVAEQYLVRRS